MKRRLADLVIQRRFATYAWAVLGWNLVVVVWGAFVRASGSGAGCGDHWPLCNGVVIPRAAAIETLIEFAHRLTSGVAGLAVLGLLVWGRRAWPRGSRVRLGATASAFFLVTEALLGAGLVKLGLVDKDASAARAFAMAAHLVNTFFLVASLALTAWWSSTAHRPTRQQDPIKRLTPLFGVALVATLLVGISGAIAALGDTLFPAASLAEGMRQDFSPTAHFLLRLRVFHPLLAVGAGLYLVGLAGLATLRGAGTPARRLGPALAGVVSIQVAVGVANLILLAPIWIQLLHLLLADLVWIMVVLLTEITLRTPFIVPFSQPTGTQVISQAAPARIGG